MSQESQGNGALSSELSPASTFSPPRHSTPLRPSSSLETALRKKASDLSEDVSLLWSGSSQTTQSSGILRSSDATELQAKQVRFGDVIQNGSLRHRLYSDTDESESEVVSGWRPAQGVANGLFEAADSLTLGRSRNLARSTSSSAITVTETITTMNDMLGTPLYSDSEDEEEVTRRHTRSTATTSRQWQAPKGRRSVYLVKATSDGSSPPLRGPDHWQQHREAWLATAGVDATAAEQRQGSLLARVLCSVFFGFWKQVYVLTTAVIVTDTWLLSRMTPQRRKRLAVWLFALVMLPLLAWLCYEESGTTLASLPAVQPTLASAGSHVYGVAAAASKAVGAALTSWSFTPAWLSWPSSGIPSPPPVAPVELEKHAVDIELMSEERIGILVAKALAANRQNDEQEAAVKSEQMRQLKHQMDTLQIAIDRLGHSFESRRDCCPDVAALLAGLDSKIISRVLEVMNDTSEEAPRSLLQQWMTQEMERRGASLDGRLDARLGEHRRSLQAELVATARMASEAQRQALEAQKIAQAVVAERQRSQQLVPPSTSVTVGMDEVTRVVKGMLDKYAADKTGLPDYALESAGGSVVNTRCTDTYTERSPKYYMFGLPLWTFYRTAREAITPGMHPGECWAFRGSQGHLVVKLAQRIKVTAFSVEHIPRSLVSFGDTSSAPKDFQMWGLDSETDTTGRLLGTYTYDAEADPLQYFIVQDPEPAVYEYVEMKILSNHGNLEYTCLYRLRVHGEPT